MSIKIHQHQSNHFASKINITGSKSISNRMLIINALYKNLSFINLSNSQDTNVLQQALAQNSNTVNIHHAGTAMRFLTAFYAFCGKDELLLTGSSRMQERPIKILVDALNQLGANISYQNKVGYPPIIIKKAQCQQNHIQLQANISSQYITALMLIAPSLPNGLEIELVGKITSLPYIAMTQSLMQSVGLDVSFVDGKITIPNQTINHKKEVVIESDWSSASYYYSLAALSNQSEIELHSYQKNSTQGDSHIADIYKQYFGVDTKFHNNQIIITKNKTTNVDFIELDLNKTPDIAQTIAVTCAGLNLKCKLTGLETLKIKETDRLLALQTELKKVGAIAKITDSTLEIVDFTKPQNNIHIATYQDHRMAMAFAPLATKIDLTIEEHDVVNKSYPDFWNDWKKLGFNFG